MFIIHCSNTNEKLNQAFVARNSHSYREKNKLLTDVEGQQLRDKKIIEKLNKEKQKLNKKKKRQAKRQKQKEQKNVTQ
jgi:hypothetical protein